MRVLFPQRHRQGVLNSETSGGESRVCACTSAQWGCAGAVHGLPVEGVSVIQEGACAVGGAVRASVCVGETAMEGFDGGGIYGVFHGKGC